MTDPIKALADAAREVLDYAKRSSIGAGDWVEATLADAIAAYDAAQASQPPTDAELESAIDAYRDACYAHARAATFGEDDDKPSTALAADVARKALASLARARQEPEPEPSPSDAEIEAALTAVEDAAYDHGIAVVQSFEDTRPLLERRHEACEAARQLMRRARPDDGLLRTEFGISSYPVPGKASDGWPDNFSVWRLKDGRTRIYRQAVAPTDAEVEGCNATELREALFNRNNDVERLVEQRDGLLRAAKAVLAVDVLMRNAQNGMPAHVFNGVLEVLQEEAIPDLRAEVARLEGK